MSGAMDFILDNLNRVDGVAGTIITTRDGLMVAWDTQINVDKDAIAALGATIFQTINKGLEQLEFGEFSHYIMNSQNGRMALMAAGNAILIALLEKNVNLGLTILELKRSVSMIKDKLNF